MVPTAQTLRLNHSLSQAAPSQSPDRKALRRGIDSGIFTDVNLVAGAVLLVALFLGPLFAGYCYQAGDIQGFHIPLRWFYAECLRKGSDFLWCPGLYCGFYLHGEGQIGMLHPLHLLTYGWLPLSIAFPLEFIGNYLFGYAGLALWLRSFRASWPIALWIGGMVLFSGFIGSYLEGVNMVGVLGHIPWLLWSITRMEGDRRHRGRWIAVIAALTGSQILLGHPQSVWFSLIAEIWWITYRATAGGSRRWILSYVGAKALGAGLGAAQWLPTLDLLMHSQRGHRPLQAEVLIGMHPLDLLQLCSPYLFPSQSYLDNGASLYCGASVGIVVFWFCLRRCGDPEDRRLIRGCLSLAALAFCLSLGRFNPANRLLELVPIVGKFRDPCRHLLLLQLAWCPLAAKGMTRLLEAPGGSARCLRPLALLPAMSVLVLVAYVLRGHLAVVGADTHSVARVGAGTAIVCIIAGLSFLAARGWRWAIPLLILASVADCMIYRLSPWWHNSPVPVSRTASLFPEPPATPGARVHVSYANRHWENILLMQGYRLYHGYVALWPERKRSVRPEALQQAGVGWMLRDTPPQWTRLPIPSPRARLLDIQGNDVVGTVGLREDQPGRIECVVYSPQPARLRIDESYHTGWRAESGGRLLPIAPDRTSFLLVSVPAGDSNVHLRFQPSSVRVGAGLSLLSLAALLAGVVATTANRRSRPR